MLLPVRKPFVAARLRLLLLLVLATAGCRPAETPPPTGGNGTPATELRLSTDKARYAPGAEVTFTLSDAPPAGARVRYRHLDQVVGEEDVAAANWRWTAPAPDFTGYLAEVVQTTEGAEQVVATVGVDVSSDWTRFPRYGFLSAFGQMETAAMGGVMDQLNRHHINGIQFYDWHYDHHRPLAGTATQPEPSWLDIAGRRIYLATVSAYIDAAHARNMKAMFYNLIYGALNNAAQDGVLPQWYLYQDASHTTADKFVLPAPPFRSDIALLNPANPDWQRYLAGENEKVYGALPFDGYHMDQLGNRGRPLYDYDGKVIDLPGTFGPFIEAMKRAHPDKALVLNAVNQYGQAGIAQAPTSFLYTEVWGPNEDFADLAKILNDNRAYGNGAKNTVLAAYLNYDLAERPGLFNTPGVLLADAVIFAWGGSHLELGEHMLGKEYFPNNNLKMKPDLQRALVDYYDFLVAYQNLLRDGGTFNQPQVSGIGQVALGAWPPQRGQVTVVGKEVGNRQLLHLLNFSGATTLNWRDKDGTQAYPPVINNLKLTVASPRVVKKMWLASPDTYGGAPQSLAFTQNGGQVSFTLPSLHYWNLVVLDL